MTEYSQELKDAWATLLNSKTNAERAWGIQLEGVRYYIIELTKTLKRKDLIKYQLICDNFLWSDQEWVQNAWKWKSEGVKGKNLGDRDFRNKYLITTAEKILNKGKELGKVNITRDEMLQTFWDVVDIISRDNFPWATSLIVKEELASLYQ